MVDYKKIYESYYNDDDDDEEETFKRHIYQINNGGLSDSYEGKHGYLFTVTKDVTFSNGLVLKKGEELDDQSSDFDYTEEAYDGDDGKGVDVDITNYYLKCPVYLGYIDPNEPEKFYVLTYDKDSSDIGEDELKDEIIDTAGTNYSIIWSTDDLIQLSNSLSLSDNDEQEIIDDIINSDNF